jgi:membrane protease YdiL (CAAX protease family)
MKGIPESTAIPVAAAFIVELTFYLLAGTGTARNWLGSCGKNRVPWVLGALGVVPWLIYSLATREAHLTAFLALLLIVLGVAFWYAVLPAMALVDGLFLAALAAIYLSRAFDWIYPSPIVKQSISLLGKLMLIRTAAAAILVIRGNVKAEFRFLPDRGEWAKGLLFFAPALAVVGITYWALGLIEMRVHPLNVLQALGTFVGILWAVALPEEFFFRGLLQQWLERWTGHAIVALLLASVIFGSAHLGFHRIFPNWRWSIVAAVLGLFLGLAWRNSRSVQTSMVTHALIVTVWRTFLR